MGKGKKDARTAGFEVTIHVEIQPPGLCLFAYDLSEATAAARGTAQGLKRIDHVGPQSGAMLSQHMGPRHGLGRMPVA